MKSSGELKRITVRNKPLTIMEGTHEFRHQGSQGTKAVECAIATKDGMNVRVRSDEMVMPDAEVYFYVKLQHPWKRSDGSDDYDEFVTDGEVFYFGFRPLGSQRIEFNPSVVAVINKAIEKFVAELTS